MNEPRACDETEVRRLVEVQKLVDELTDSGPMILWPLDTTGRKTKRALRAQLDEQRSELNELRRRQSQIARGLLLLLRKELP
jgi:hypothetical protein